MNTIQFENVLPLPLKDTPLQGDVWKTTLVLDRGKKYLVKAESGKGKSTMLNIIYGTRKDFEGTVIMGQVDRKIGDADLSQIRSNKIGYLFQDLRLFGQLTALENILLKPGCVFAVSEIEYYADLLGVKNQLYKTCSKLSLGQQQRIALIRAVSQNFEWLLLDEPFSHLDLANAKKAIDMIHGRAEKLNAGIIATSLGDDSVFEDYTLIQL